MEISALGDLKLTTENYEVIEEKEKKNTIDNFLNNPFGMKKE